MITQAADKQHCLPDIIRHKFNAGSLQNREYINAFHEHSNELVHIFCVNPEILIMWDDLMNEFNTNEISAGKVSKESNARMKAILDEVYLLASDKLKLTIEEHKFEIDHFPDTMAFMLFSFYFF